MSEQRVYITNLKIMREKGKPGEETASLTLIEGQGILGDRHADGSEKQISIVTKEAVDFIKNSPEPGLCFARYKGNIEVAALTNEMGDLGDLADELVDEQFQLKPGMRLVQRNSSGEVAIEITSGIKKCFPECTLVREGKPCGLAGKGCYGKAVRGGVLEVGEGVVYDR